MVDNYARVGRIRVIGLDRDRDTVGLKYYFLILVMGFYMCITSFL